MVSISFLRPGKFFSLTQIWLLLVGFHIMISADNFHLVDALIRSQNLVQAQAYLMRIPNLSPDRNLYQGLITCWLGEHESGADLIKNSYPRASKRTQWKAKEHLLTFFQTKPVEPKLFFDMTQVIFGNNKPAGAWKEEWARYLFYTEKYSEIIEIGRDFDSAGLMNWVYKAYKITGAEKKFFESAGLKNITSPPLIKEHLRLMLEAGLQDDAMSYFEAFKDGKEPWVADLFLLLGTELNRQELLVTGYLRRIHSAPNVFDNYRSLSALYFKAQKDLEAERILFEYLKKFPHKYQGAREIAEALVDHGRLKRLRQFIISIRLQLNDPLALHDLALYTYSISQDYESFFRELLKIDARISGEIWGQKIVDSFHHDEVVGAFKFFKKLHGQNSDVVAPVLFHIVRKLENPTDLWIDMEIESMSVTSRLNLAGLAKQYSIPQLIIRILARDPSTLSEVSQIRRMKLLGNAYASTGKFIDGNRVLEQLTANSQSLEDLLSLANCTYNRPELRTKLPGYFDRLETPTNWNLVPDASKSRLLEQVLEVLAFEKKYERIDELSKKYSSLISRDTQHYIGILRDIFTNGESGFEKIPAFLSNRVGSANFPKVQEMYMLYLDLITVTKEPFFKLLISGLRYAYLGDSGSLAQSILKFEESLSGHWIKNDLKPLIAYLDCIYHRLKVDLSLTEQDKKLALDRWEKQALKLFEEFPNSLYTPRVINELVSSFENTGRSKEKLDLIRKYLLQSASDLLAQRLRSLLL